MVKQKTLRGKERLQLLEELDKKYSYKGRRSHSFLYFRKKYTWLLVVGGTKALKRIGDIVISSILLVTLIPLFLIISILIKWHDKGPVFYVTNRVGKWGKEFRFPKFRSMKIGSEKMLEVSHLKNEKEGTKRFKLKDDPRVTPIGKMLRKTSVDELPQLWCVLKGEMSLVGPRPPLPSEVAQYTLEERRRLDVVPGLTCFWQVEGRSEIPFSKQVELDLQYIESQSIWVDLKILIQTIPAVIFGKGAY